MIQVISETNNPLEDDHRDVGCTECKNEEEKLLEDPEEILKFFYEMQLKEEEEMRAEEEKTVRETLSKKMPTTPAHLYEQFKSHQDTNEVKTEPTILMVQIYFIMNKQRSTLFFRVIVARRELIHHLLYHQDCQLLFVGSLLLGYQSNHPLFKTRNNSV
eukprot:TRINITY_DN4115_c0_g1_i14.p1 TRINITY_DN4115_c0_g1~~TRINITY_DN4115_c0_g1_i14.p1  ORF type:complete len:159 (-),score=35.75 TRINITY_DN4115_c0_g1_i14:167-643(-)